MPGTRANDSDRLICSWPCWICAPSTVSIAIGKSKARSSTRVAVTTTGSMRSAVCALASAASAIAHIAAPARKRPADAALRVLCMLSGLVEGRHADGA